ncbi:DUF3465 domain-containing protein [Novacetimonas hansenii]|uniref:DUF3465 domain-containing protein n=1 Tax=Novacetimonas hansenii TaxID=436 RepID=UPI000789B671|nr:DUF3465 domain-containing protein [Novacetimonas hansenii]RFP05791.1 hypothetical protein BGC30_06685 [Novacetimonas hansenii]WEQ58849.1 DUF3465 domain-containing protein [Novacetimonas hansenii]CUW47662.1 hypothetical protein ATCC53582_01780 [Novacetimonas hansenii]
MSARLTLLRSACAGAMLMTVAQVMTSATAWAWGESVSVSPTCDNHRFLEDQRKFENEERHTRNADLAEHVCGRVIAVSRARRTRSGWHGYFYVDVGSGISIRIVSDLDRMDAPQWPWVAKGDDVDVVGRYYFDNMRSQGIDWTHHGTGRNWPIAGYVTVNGHRYE